MIKVTKQLSLCLVGLICSLLISVTADNIRAQVPRQFNYQGLIQTQSGQPIPDGDHSVTVSLYVGDIGGDTL